MSCQSAIEKTNHYPCASVTNSEKRSARNNGKSWFCHLINASSLQKNVPFTLLSHQVPIATPTGKDSKHIPPCFAADWLCWADSASWHQDTASKLRWCPCTAVSQPLQEPLLSPCLKLDTNCNIKHWLLLCQ